MITGGVSVYQFHRWWDKLMAKLTQAILRYLFRNWFHICCSIPGIIINCCHNWSQGHASEERIIRTSVRTEPSFETSTPYDADSFIHSVNVKSWEHTWQEVVATTRVCPVNQSQKLTSSVPVVVLRNSQTRSGSSHKLYWQEGGKCCLQHPTSHRRSRSQLEVFRVFWTRRSRHRR